MHRTHVRIEEKKKEKESVYISSEAGGRNSFPEMLLTDVWHKKLKKGVGRSSVCILI